MTKQESHDFRRGSIKQLFENQRNICYNGKMAYSEKKLAF